MSANLHKHANSRSKLEGGSGESEGLWSEARLMGSMSCEGIEAHWKIRKGIRRWSVLGEDVTALHHSRRCKSSRKPYRALHNRDLFFVFLQSENKQQNHLIIIGRSGQRGNCPKIAKNFDYILCTGVQGSESLKQLVADISEREYLCHILFLVHASPKSYALWERYALYPEFYHEGW